MLDIGQRTASNHNSNPNR